jgi:hypothetical protein
MKRMCSFLLAASFVGSTAHAGPTVKRSSWWTEIRQAVVPVNPWFGGIREATRRDGPLPCPDGQRALLMEVQVTPTGGRRPFDAGSPVAFDGLGAWTATLTAYSSDRQSIRVVVRGRDGERATASFAGGIPFDAWSPLGAPRAFAGGITHRVAAHPNAGAGAGAFASVTFTTTTTLACGFDDKFSYLGAE